MFDVIFFNACFGNFFDPDATIEKASGLLKTGGTIIISHPLGNRFVACLKEANPSLVMRLLPARPELAKFEASYGLTLNVFENEPDFYLALLKQKA
jgi:hypothetical protein